MSVVRRPRLLLVYGWSGRAECSYALLLPAGAAACWCCWRSAKGLQLAVRRAALGSGVRRAKLGQALEVHVDSVLDGRMRPACAV